MDSTLVEREKRWRLEKVVHLCECQLQQLAQQAWAACSPDAATNLSRVLPPFQRKLLAETTCVDSWDVSMCNAVLKHLGALKTKQDANAVAAIVRARNHCAHAAGGRVASEAFEHHVAACETAMAVLGGDVEALRKIRACDIDATDASVLTCSLEASKLAETEKIEGNRLFREGDFAGARECYTRGIQVAGVVDPVLLSQLYNNRATAHLRLNHLTPAKADAKHAAELAPQWAKPHVRLAEIYRAMSKPHKAAARLEIALGHATAANDAAAIKEVTANLSVYRSERDEASRRESENLAYGTSYEMEGAFLAANQARLGLSTSQNPMDLLNKFAAIDVAGMGTKMQGKKHVLLGQQARNDGRLVDAAREFMGAAAAGDPEGMYNYALCLMKGRGTRKDIPEAVRWLEKAAAMPIVEGLQGKIENVGIGEAMASLGNLYDSGVHFARDKRRASAYWEKSASLGTSTGLNNFGLCLMNGTHGVKKDLPRAREFFRRSAECLHNEAMSNLSKIHATLHDFETAARWAESAAKYGFLPASTQATEYRKLADVGIPKQMRDITVKILDAMDKEIDTRRHNGTPSLEELRAIGTPYGKRLLLAKQRIGDAVAAFHAGDLERAVALAVEAHRIDDCSLVFSPQETQMPVLLVKILQANGVHLDADLALLSKPIDESSSVVYWQSLQSQFPNDLHITRLAACMSMFKGYAGADVRRGVQLFQRAFTLLPNPHDDSDPVTLALLYEAAVGYYQNSDIVRAKDLFTRFLQHAPADGHRKAAEANYFLGEIALMNASGSRTVLPTLAKHLEAGDRLLHQIPSFLRGPASESPHREMLKRILDAAGLATGQQVQTPPSPRANQQTKRGGELLDGPRRLEELRSDSPTLQPQWRSEIASFAQVAANNGQVFTSAPPAQPSTRSKPRGRYSLATIDELFSALEDRVYHGRQIKCIVVSLPTFTGSSFQFVVEDSQREPARIAVYGAPDTMLASLVPGREFLLLDPYVRIARDGMFMLRVDKPSSTIRVQAAAHQICWTCSFELAAPAQPKRCARCRKAVYCSKACQVTDWRANAHRNQCSQLAERR
ncbi:hypothetical protein P43SY_011712 [Pythium insidiosum]|uniref:MYND-type domain-containing protein n=1 Tax=Pythium insidiosum TaxID=114742 RepID=A0AAD5LA12_PYTIN|nr:hypothetical protein P43SY_011712 [Pythium insidiosum]